LKTLNKKGQGITEYLILTALIAVGSIAIVQVLSRNIRTQFTVVNEAIRGKKKPRLEGEEATQRYYRKYHMSDFAESATYSDEK
jgi:pilus assembly protein Flp/PilA